MTDHCHHCDHEKARNQMTLYGHPLLPYFLCFCDNMCLMAYLQKHDTSLQHPAGGRHGEQDHA